MNLLWDMTLRGSLVFLLVAGLDLAFGNRLSAAARRLWWCAVPLAFLFPFRIAWNHGQDWALPLHLFPGLSAPGTAAGPALPTAMENAGAFPWLMATWILGTFVYLLVLLVQTLRISRRWSRKRLCTDSRLLNLMEACKKDLGVTAPVGLVLTDEVSSPAILGWLRPRILLPSTLTQSMSAHQLKAVLLHELSHFRWADIPFGWLLTLVRALHWFNPLAHLAAWQWTKFREEAADECSLNALPSGLRQSYGETLLQALRWSQGRTSPFGSLAIAESVRHLKKRIRRISNYSRGSQRFWPACLAFLLLSGLIVLQPAGAAPDPQTSAAVTAMTAWLKVIDQGSYPASWDEAAKSFRTAVTKDQWIQALQGARTPLASCLDRKLVSAFYQTEVPAGNGKVIKGEFVIAQFESSFSNLKYALETVTFEKEADGGWKASGYYIKPRSAP